MGTTSTLTSRSANRLASLKLYRNETRNETGLITSLGDVAIRVVNESQ